MQIIWNQLAAAQLKDDHVVLELETFFVNGENITAYCVVPPEAIFNEMTQIENSKNLHMEFVRAFLEKNYTICENLYPTLQGKFGGELDSFYEEILKKIKTAS